MVVADGLGGGGVWGLAVAEMDRVTWSIYSGGPGGVSLHRILYLVSYHFISSHYTWNYTLPLSYLLMSLALHDTAWILTAG
jgi:hypothetical protein